MEIKRARTVVGSRRIAPENCRVGNTTRGVCTTTGGCGGQKGNNIIPRSPPRRRRATVEIRVSRNSHYGARASSGHRHRRAAIAIVTATSLDRRRSCVDHVFSSHVLRATVVALPQNTYRHPTTSRRPRGIRRRETQSSSPTRRRQRRKKKNVLSRFFFFLYNAYSFHRARFFFLSHHNTTTTAASLQLIKFFGFLVFFFYSANNSSSAFVPFTRKTRDEERHL